MPLTSDGSARATDPFAGVEHDGLKSGSLASRSWSGYGLRLLNARSIVDDCSPFCT